MKLSVTKLTREESIIVVEESSGRKKEVVVEVAKSGNKWTNFDKWDITDDEYIALEEFTISVSNLMPMLDQ